MPSDLCEEVTLRVNGISAKVQVAANPISRQDVRLSVATNMVDHAAIISADDLAKFHGVLTRALTLAGQLPV